MNAPEVTNRPKKRRKTKGYLAIREDDVQTADAIVVQSVVRETDDGPVEEETRMPVWRNCPPPIIQRLDIPEGSGLPYYNDNPLEMPDSPVISRTPKVWHLQRNNLD